MGVSYRYLELFAALLYHRIVPHAGRTDLIRSRVLQEHSLPEHGNRKPKWGLSREQGPFSAGQIERWFGACAAHFLEG